MNIGNPVKVHEDVELEEFVPSGPAPSEPRKRGREEPIPSREPALVPAKR